MGFSQLIFSYSHIEHLIFPFFPHKLATAGYMVLFVSLLFKHNSSFPTSWPLHLPSHSCEQSSLRLRAFPGHLSTLTGVGFPEVRSWQGHPAYPLRACVCNTLPFLNRSLLIFSFNQVGSSSSGSVISMS